MRAVTLGREADPDVVVARRLASACQLDWTRIDLSDLAHGTPSELMAMAMAAAWRRDASTNAIAALMLDEAESRMPSGPRFHGSER